MIICDRCGDNSTGTVRHCTIKISVSDHVGPDTIEKTIKDEYLRSIDLCAKCRKEIFELSKEKPALIPPQWVEDQKRIRSQEDPG